MNCKPIQQNYPHNLRITPNLYPASPPASLSAAVIFSYSLRQSFHC